MKIRKVYKDDKVTFLVTIRNKNVTYLTFYSLEVLDDEDNFVLIYGMEKGGVQNDIFEGIMMSNDYNKQTTEERFLAFLNAINEYEEISAATLGVTIQTTVHGNYGDPF